jgi:aromatic-L-amino-acid decarboxylase
MPENTDPMHGEFRARAHEIVDWIADYLEGIERYPVKSQVRPGETRDLLPLEPPEEGEPFDALLNDFQSIILPGITHWQHPSFFAYFPANSSPPSLLAEMLTSALGAQCMSWATSPAATELEERVMEWLRGMLGLPADWQGVIQDTASTATLCSILTAREEHSRHEINRRGFTAADRFTVYCSTEAHSSIEKAVRIAGLGREHLRKIGVDSAYAMRPDLLRKAIEQDRASGYAPLCIVSALGTTGSTAVDPLEEIGAIARANGLWLHIDAAFAGTALMLPEYRHLLKGIEDADTFVFNPHKWMFTNFDCSAYFVKDRDALVRTFEILPEYLKTHERESVNNYRDWGIQLGRRFRALKLWFVIRTYGVAGLRERIRAHIAMADRLAATIRDAPDFEILAPVWCNVICFRYKPKGLEDPERLNAANEKLMDLLNGSGTLFLTHTKLEARTTLRLVIGQTNVEQRHVDAAWETIAHTARGMAF